MPAAYRALDAVTYPHKYLICVGPVLQHRFWQECSSMPVPKVHDGLDIALQGQEVALEGQQPCSLPTVAAM
jgi:hypothetical protein